MQFTWTVVVGLFAGLVVAPAQDGRGGGQFGQDGFGRGQGRGRPSVGFSTLDSNGDGVLDAQEIASAPASLAKLDKNSDGQISSDEARPSMPEGRGRGPGGGRGDAGGEGGSNVVEEMVKTLMAFDANADGKLSKSEMPERFQGIFDRADENKDGFLTPEEIRKMAAAQAAAPASTGPGGRGDGEGRRNEGPRGEINFIRMDPVLAAVDTNGDGILSAGEIRDAPESLRKLDKNGDGKVTREEAIPAGGRGRGF